MFRSSRASKKSSGRADRPIYGGRPTATHVPLLPSKRPENVRRTARMPHARVTPPGVPRASRLRMHKRKLLIGLATAGLLLAGFGAATMPASAEQRTLLVTLVGGAQVTVTVDVPPGTPTDQIQIPGVSAPIASVQDITPAQPAPAPSPDAAARPGAGRPQRRPERQHPGARVDSPSSSSPSSSNGSQGASQDNSSKPTAEPLAGQQAQQVTTGKLRARLKLRSMLPRRPRTPPRRRPRTRSTRRRSTPG